MISTIHLLNNCGQDQYMNSLKAKYKDLEVVGTRKKRAREKETRVSPSRALRRLKIMKQKGRFKILV